MAKNRRESKVSTLLEAVVLRFAAGGLGIGTNAGGGKALEMMPFGRTIGASSGVASFNGVQVTLYEIGVRVALLMQTY